jgi:hypothetical protein
MDMLESIGWIAAGFVPTFISLHVGYNIRAKKISRNGHPITPVTSK